MMRAPKNNRRGTSLLEMLAYVAILGLLINAILGVMAAAGRLNAIGIATLDRMKNAGDIRETFLRDVKTAASVAETAASYKTTENQLVLELPAVEASRRYVVYGLLKSQRRLDRLEFELSENQAAVVKSFQTFPLDLEGFRVETAPQGPVSIELDADVVGNRPVPPGAKRKPPVTYTFTAATRSAQGRDVPNGGDA